MRDIAKDPLRVGLRCQDIQTSIQDVDLGPLNAETKGIRLTGMAVRLAIHIRGADVIDDYKRLEYISSQFGIDSLVLPKVLEVLQDLDWIRVEQPRTDITKIEESVPYFGDIYSAAGDRYLNTPHSEIEQVAIAICDQLALAPSTENDVKDECGLDSSSFSMLLDIGRSGSFIAEYESSKSGEKILYSPLYWLENPSQLEQMFAFLKQFGAERVLSALSAVRTYQGLPVPQDLRSGASAPGEVDVEVIREAVRRGIILAPKVSSHSGPRNFAFTPQIGVSLEEKVILEKAMAILASVRYGEHFGSITKIRYPGAILNSLLNPPHRIGPHTEIRKQYAILVGRGMGRVFPHRSQKSRCFFELIPTEENKKAVRLASDLLAVGEAIHEKRVSAELMEVLFYQGTYEEALRTIPRLRKPGRVSRQTTEAVFDVMNDTMDRLRGAW